MAKYSVPKPKDLLSAGVHFGHQVRRWHPSMAPYIFTAKKNIHVIDLATTEKGLKEACEFLYKTASEGGQIIFVGTKKQAREIIENEAKRCGAFFVSNRWLGGTITNFGIIKKNTAKLTRLIKEREAGEHSHYTKKERLLIDREIAKLTTLVGGIVGLTKIPQAIFVVDARREKTAIREAARANVKVAALVDTNTDPSDVNYVIAGNDDAIKSIALILKTVADAVEAGYKDFEKKSKPEGKEAKKEKDAKKDKSAKEEVAEETVDKTLKVTGDKSPIVTEKVGKKLVEEVKKGESTDAPIIEESEEVSKDAKEKVTTKKETKTKVKESKKEKEKGTKKSEKKSKKEAK